MQDDIDRDACADALATLVRAALAAALVSVHKRSANGTAGTEPGGAPDRPARERLPTQS